MATFPQAPLDVQVDLNLAGTWTGITSKAMQRGGTTAPMSITRGRADETAKVTACAYTAEWNNRDGRFSPRNPTGPYYGQLTRNTPLRVSVPSAVTYLRMEDDAASYVSCPDSASLQLTSGLAVLAEIELSTYMPSVLCSKWGATGTAWALSLNASGTLTFTWNTGSAVIQATSTLPVPLGHICIEVFITTASGTVTFQTGGPGYTSMTQLGAVVGPGTATTVSAAAGQAVAVGDSATFDATYGTHGCQGKIYNFFLQNASFTNVASPAFTSATPGAGSLTDAQGNVWTLAGTATFSNRLFRGHFECSSLPQRWDVTGTDIWTPVTASGVIRRLQQGSAPVRSAMRRFITGYPSVKSATLTGSASSQAQSTIAYWPCEDTQGSTTIASGLAVNTDGIVPAPMQFSGSPGFQGTAGSASADSAFACSLQLPQVGSSTWTAQVPPYSVNADTFSLTWLLAIPSGGIGSNVTLLSFAYYNSVNQQVQVTVLYSTAFGGSLSITEAGTNSGNIVTGANGLAFWVQVTHFGTFGTGTPETLTLLQTGPGGPSATGSVATGTGFLTSFTVNPGGANLGATEMGHFWVSGAGSAAGVSAGVPAVVPVNAATNVLNAYTGEAAAARVARLCRENGIQARILGYPAVSVAMGAQQIDTLVNILQSCEDADRGILYEPAECLGIGYRTLASLCNQAPAVTLDYSQATLGGDGGAGLAPVDDDQFTLNDVTLTRSGGTSYRTQVTAGPLSISPPPAGAGDYNTALTVFTQYDAQLPGVASWIAHVGTTNQERYPGIPLNLARPELASLQAAIAAVRIGDHARITNPPAFLPPGPIDQLVWGSSEQLGGFFWLLSWNAVPELPYEVAAAGASAGATGAAHADTAGSALHTSVTSTATSLVVDITAGNLWTTAAGDFPFDIQIGGERCTVTAITGSSSPQTFTVTRSVNGVAKAQTATTPISLWNTPVLALTGAP